MKKYIIALLPFLLIGCNCLLGKNQNEKESKIMTAAEARETVNDYNDSKTQKSLRELLEWIVKRAEKGENYTWLLYVEYCPDDGYVDCNYITRELREMGYFVGVDECKHKLEKEQQTCKVYIRW